MTPLFHRIPIMTPKDGVQTSTSLSVADDEVTLADNTMDKEAGNRPIPEVREKEITMEELDDGWEDDLRNPQNWKRSKRWKLTLTIALTGFISTSGSSIIAPSTHQVLEDLAGPGGKEQVGILLTSVYVLGLGAGPFIFSPISELYGRQLAYILSTGPFVIFCAACCASQNLQTAIILRFLCGVFGSSGPALGIATVADMFRPNERGKPVAIYALGPMGGPTLGSMLGFWLLLASWRWVLGFLAIISFINFILICSFMEETYAGAIKRFIVYENTHHIEHPTSFIARLSPTYLVDRFGWVKTMVPLADARRVFGNAFSRPPRLLFTNPVCFMFSAYYAYLYGTIYVFIVAIPILFGSPPWSIDGLFSYGFPQAIIPLAYIGLAFGFFTSAAVAARYQDRIYKRLRKRNGDDGQPEYRLIMVQVGTVVFPIGMLIFAWTAQAHTHWMGPLVGQAILGLGLLLAWQSIQTYLVDAFFPYSAASMAGATALRSILGALMPIFTPPLFHNLGWGKGGTILACLAAVAIPAPLIMFKYGKGLRDRYKFNG